MKPKSKTVGVLLQFFFGEFLPNQKNASTQTISSYRDTFILLLRFIKDRSGIAPEQIAIPDLDVAIILAFLDHLESERKNCVSSRNARLAAIRSFFRMVALRSPESIGHCNQILSIPTKRTDRKLVLSLSKDEMEALLAVHDTGCWSGRRDSVLLLTLYNTGARVSELMKLEQKQVTFGSTSFLRLYGKGRKERTVPLWARTSRVLRSWFAELSVFETALAFPNAQGKQLTRNGLDYILQQAVLRASSKCPSLQQKNVTPHTIRHTTATHLLQAGADVAIIALWLGHESMDTTRKYLEADLATKQKALNALSAPAISKTKKFKPSDKILDYLSGL
jgi:site-specific recombinase XerD